MDVEKSGWSGEGLFTAVLVEHLEQVPGVRYLRVEDAPASRSEADYNFISNEIYVAFETRPRRERFKRFGVLPASREVLEKAMTLAGLEQALSAAATIGPPDYTDDEMLQYLRTERIVPPYQTRGYKLVEMVRIYEIR
ncbi:MAG TPA: hypothetical protein VL309_00210 [Vicinamibacterales bacterium]|jgi:hypothetical protein|nr:hypothetical protein [Vicinamibacterales bacterium]